MSLAFHHSLHGNQNNERIRHLLVFDVESKLLKGEKNKTYFDPFLWTLIYSRQGEQEPKHKDKKMWGTSINDFWDKVEHYTYAKEKTVLSSHHLEPDFIPMQGIIILPERGWIMTKYINHAKILMMEFRKQTSTLLVTNSGNIFPGGIADWGESLGIPKLEMPSEKAPLSKWIPYCMRDSEVLLEMWRNYINFLDLHDLGNMQYTAASQAMNAFRHRFMPVPIAIHAHRESMSLERAAYHGGRFQALAIGSPASPKFWQLDINSMYGKIMRDEQLPSELRGYNPHGNLRILTALMKKYLVIAELTVQCDEPFFPHILDGKIKYKGGLRHVAFSTPEIKYLLKHGKILHVGQIAWYKPGRIFKDYTKYFLDLRAKYKSEGNPVFEKLAKLFVNSLYGKFGQYGYAEKVIGECDPNLIKYEESYDSKTRKTIGYFFFGGKIRMTEKTGNSYNTFVAIPAHITAYGRVRLWQLMKKAGLEHVFHVATDSLIVDAIGLKRLEKDIDKSKVGALKIEHTFNSLTIKAPNDMVMDGREKIKGVSKKADKLAANTYVITQWPRFNTLLKKGEVEKYFTRSVTKTLKREEFMSLDEEGNKVSVRVAYPKKIK